MKITPKITKAINRALRITGSSQTFDEIVNLLKAPRGMPTSIMPDYVITKWIDNALMIALDPTTIKKSMFDVDPAKMSLANARHYAQVCQDAVDSTRDELDCTQQDLLDKNRALSVKLADAIEEGRVLADEKSNDDSLLKRLAVDLKENAGFFTRRTIMHYLGRKIIKDREAMKKNEFKNKLKGTNNGRKKKR